MPAKRCTPTTRDVILYVMLLGLGAYLALVGFVFPSSSPTADVPREQATDGGGWRPGDVAPPLRKAGQPSLSEEPGDEPVAREQQWERAAHGRDHGGAPPKPPAAAASAGSNDSPQLPGQRAEQQQRQQHHQQHQASQPPPPQRQQQQQHVEEEQRDGMYFERRSRTWQPCPHLFYVMPSEFEHDGVLSIWTQHTYAALARAPCRTDDRAAAAVLVPGIETACPVNWPHFGNHVHFQRNYVFINSTRKCHETLPERLRAYWDRHGLDAAVTALPEPAEAVEPAAGGGNGGEGGAAHGGGGGGAEVAAAAAAAEEEHGGRGRGRLGKFVVVFRSGGFPTAWLETGFPKSQIILAHSSRTVTNTAQSLQVAYPVMPLTIPADRGAVARDPCRARPLFASFQGSRTWKTRELLLPYNAQPDVVINLADTTRAVDAVDAAVAADAAPGAAAAAAKAAKEASDEYQRNFLALLHDSVFTFVVRGHNLFSFRFPEAIASGSIPVILADGWHLPFSGAPAMNYSEWSFQFPEREAGTLMDTLRALSPERICEMQQNLRRVYEEHFETFQAQVDTFVTVVMDLVDRRAAWLEARQQRQQQPGKHSKIRRQRRLRLWE